MHTCRTILRSCTPPNNRIGANALLNKFAFLSMEEDFDYVAAPSTRRTRESSRLVRPKKGSRAGRRAPPRTTVGKARAAPSTWRTTTTTATDATSVATATVGLWIMRVLIFLTIFVAFAAVALFIAGLVLYNQRADAVSTLDKQWERHFSEVRTIIARISDGGPPWYRAVDYPTQCSNEHFIIQREIRDGFRPKTARW